MLSNYGCLRIHKNFLTIFVSTILCTLQIKLVSFCNKISLNGRCQKVSYWQKTPISRLDYPWLLFVTLFEELNIFFLHSSSHWRAQNKHANRSHIARNARKTIRKGAQFAVTNKVVHVVVIIQYKKKIVNVILTCSYL